MSLQEDLDDQRQKKDLKTATLEIAVVSLNVLYIHNVVDVHVYHFSGVAHKDFFLNSCIHINVFNVGLGYPVLTLFFIYRKDCN